jgi:hypothetical protein
MAPQWQNGRYSVAAKGDHDQFFPLRLRILSRRHLLAYLHKIHLLARIHYESGKTGDPARTRNKRRTFWRDHERKDLELVVGFDRWDGQISLFRLGRND